MIAGMRLLLACLAAVGLSAEAVPFIELTWVAGDGLRPAAPVAAWWDRTLADSRAWCAERLDGAQIALPQAIHVHIDAHHDAKGRAMPMWSARWDGPLPAEIGASLVKRVALWKDFRSQVGANTLALAGPDGVLDLPAPDHGPGFRMVVHWAGIELGTAKELEANPELRDQPATKDLRDLLRERSITIAVDPSPDGPVSWIDADIPAAWFRPIDPDLTARIPSKVIAAAAVGIDGQALAEAVAALPDSLRLVLGLATVQAGLALDPVAIAKAADGTWLAYGRDDDAFLVRMPRSALLDQIMAKVAQMGEVALPTDETPARLASDAAWARDEREWLFADSVERIDEWRAAHAGGDLAALGGRPAADRRIWLAAGTTLLRQESGAQYDLLLPELPLAIVRSSTVALMADYGLGLPADAWTPSLPELWPEPVCISDRTVAGRLRLHLEGAGLPWVLPGLGIAWCAATIQEQEGLIDLRQRLAAIRAAGRPATPADLVAALPPADADEDALLAALAKLAEEIPGLDEGWRRFRAEGTVRTTTAADSELIAAGDRLLAISAFLDDLTPEAIAAAILRSEAAAGRSGFDRRDLTGRSGRRLAQAGRDLMTLGDLRGLTLVERARTITGSPQSLLDGLMRGAVLTLRDDAFLVGAIAGVLPEPVIGAWLAEEPPSGFAQAMRLESVSVVGSLAMIILGESDTAEPDVPFDLRSSLFSPASLRGGIPSDLALQLAFMEWLADGHTGALPAIHRWRSLLPGMVAPAFGMLRNHERTGALRHQLLRLACRLRPGDPPADPAAAEALAGPLVLVSDHGPLPLLYRKLPTGFQLDPDPAAKPAGMPESAWKQLLAPAQDPTSAVILPTSRTLGFRFAPGAPPAQEPAEPTVLRPSDF